MADHRQLRQLRDLHRLREVHFVAAQADWSERVRAQETAEVAAKDAADRTLDAAVAWENSLALGTGEQSRLFGGALLREEQAATGARIALEAAERETLAAKADWHAADAARRAGERQLRREERRAQQAADLKNEMTVEERTMARWFRP